MAASTSITASAPHFCYPRRRRVTPLWSFNIGQTRNYSAYSRRYFQRIDQKASLTMITYRTTQLRCKSATRAYETLPTEEEVVTAAATKAVDPAQEELEGSKEAAELKDMTGPSTKPTPQDLALQPTLSITEKSFQNHFDGSTIKIQEKMTSLVSDEELTVGSTLQDERRTGRQRATDRDVPVGLTASKKKSLSFSENVSKDPMNMLQRVFLLHFLTQRKYTSKSSYWKYLTKGKISKLTMVSRVKETTEELKSSSKKDAIPFHEEDSARHIVNKDFTRSGPNMVLNTLTEREKVVMRWRFGLKDGHSRTLQEIGDMLGVGLRHVQCIESCALQKLTKFVQECIKADTDPTRDTVPCHEQHTPGYIIDKEFTKSDLNIDVDMLTAREKLVVRWRYGLEDGQARALQKNGNMMGITRERVRQIESCASEKLIEILQAYFKADGVPIRVR